MINFDSVPCTISTESSSYFDASIAWALQKNSPYKSLFNLFLTKIKENGQLQRLETKVQNIWVFFSSCSLKIREK
jgi:ABC-type amino acid transport substrate-binding protein